MAAGALPGGTFSMADDLTVTRVGYGAMQLTGPGVWGEPADHDGAVRVVRAAVEQGVDFIDTADSYGPAVSEEIIAEALHPYPENLVIATKAGFTRTGPGVVVLHHLQDLGSAIVIDDDTLHRPHLPIEMAPLLLRL